MSPETCIAGTNDFGSCICNADSPCFFSPFPVSWGSWVMHEALQGVVHSYFVIGVGILLLTIPCFDACKSQINSAFLFGWSVLSPTVIPSFLQISVSTIFFILCLAKLFNLFICCWHLLKISYFPCHFFKS